MSVVLTPHQGNISLQHRKTITEKCNQSERGLWCPVPMDTSAKAPGTCGSFAEERMGRLLKPENRGIFCEIVSASNVRTDIHKFPPTRLPKHELSRENNSGRDKVDEGKTMTLHKELKAERMLSVEEILFLREERINCYPMPDTQL